MPVDDDLENELLRKAGEKAQEYWNEDANIYQMGGVSYDRGSMKAKILAGWLAWELREHRES